MHCMLYLSACAVEGQGKLKFDLVFIGVTRDIIFLRIYLFSEFFKIIINIVKIGCSRFLK